MHFVPSTSFQVLYQFVFSHSKITGPFGVFSTYPRCLIGLDKLARDAEGILTVEEGESLIDPLSLEDKVRSILPSLAPTIMCILILLCQEESLTDSKVSPFCIDVTSGILQQGFY